MHIIFVLLLTPLLSFSKNFLPNTFSANFEESFLSLATGKEKKSFGKIDYKYPGQIRFEKTSPDQSTFVSNSNLSWYYVPPFVSGEMGQVTIQKSTKLPLTKFLDSIKDGVEKSNFFTTKFSGSMAELNFKKNYQKESNLKKVILTASKDAKNLDSLFDFDKITLEYLDGRKVNLKFIDLKKDSSFEASHFVFEVPKNTKVTE